MCRVRCFEVCWEHLHDYSVARRRACAGAEPPTPLPVAVARNRDPAVAHGVVATAPPKTNPMTAPRKEANQAAPAPAPTTSANATQASAKTAAPPASTTTTQGTPSSNTTTTPTGSTGGKATTGTTTAAGAAAGLTQDATVIVAVAINRWGKCVT